jgi:hypothetical protein
MAKSTTTGRVVIGAAMVAGLLAPATSRAQVSLGARIGYGLAMGDVGGTLAMSEWVEGQVPIQLDALYRATPKVAIGAYLSNGLGLAGEVCDGAADCSARVTRLGVQVTYSFRGERVLPWIGAGIGYEWSTVDDGSTKGTFTGFELLNLQCGGDYKVNEHLSVGPYVMLSISQFEELDLGGDLRPISDKKLHEWLSLGLRGKLDL